MAIFATIELERPELLSWNPFILTTACHTESSCVTLLLCTLTPVPDTQPRHLLTDLCRDGLPQPTHKVGEGLDRYPVCHSPSLWLLRVTFQGSFDDGFSAPPDAEPTQSYICEGKSAEPDISRQYKFNYMAGREHQKQCAAVCPLPTPAYERSASVSGQVSVCLTKSLYSAGRQRCMLRRLVCRTLSHITAVHQDLCQESIKVNSIMAQVSRRMGDAPSLALPTNTSHPHILHLWPQFLLWLSHLQTLLPAAAEIQYGVQDWGKHTLDYLKCSVAADWLVVLAAPFWKP